MSKNENDSFKKEEDTANDVPDDLKLKKTITDFEKDGLTPNAIMFGILNLVMVFFWLGHSPATYWILVMLKGTFFLYRTWKFKI